MKPIHPIGLLFPLSCILLLCAVVPGRADLWREAEALVNWKASLASSGVSLGSWSLANSSRLCRWSCITCYPEARHITELDLTDTSLNGTLDELDFSAFPHLERLTLVRSALHGTIPTGIGSLTSLVMLEMCHNLYLRGTIPRSIGQLKHLAVLQLAYLGLHGTLPEEIGNLTSLEELTLSSVTFTAGSIPQTIGVLTKLRLLDLGHNNLSGTILLEIGNMTELQSINFLGNWRLEGQLPSSISHLIKLQFLDMSSNHLGGHIVPGLGNSSVMHHVFIGNNNFSGSSICVGGALGQYQC